MAMRASLWMEDRKLQFRLALFTGEVIIDMITGKRTTA